MSPENRTIQKVRNLVLNTALVTFSLACLPALFASIARAKDIGWQMPMTAQIVVIAFLCAVTIFRHSISFTKRAFALLSSLFFLGIIGYLTFGMVGGGYLFFFTTTVLATMLFGVRWGWLTVAASMIVLACFTWLVVGGTIRYSFDMNDYVVNPSSWLTVVMAVGLFFSIVTALLGKFHTALLKIIEQSSSRAEHLAREIHERQNAEKARQVSEEKFRQILENIQDVYFETTLDGTITYCSPSCLEVSGYSQDELIGANATVLYNDPDDRELLLTPLRENGTVRGLELLFKKKNGELYDTAFNADISVDVDGTPTGLHGTIRDITVTKKQKERDQRARKMEAVGLMAGGVAHDLNNILSGIVSYPDLLLLKLPEDSDLRQPIETIRESGSRAACVVADLLTVARGAASVRESHSLQTLILEYLRSPEYEELKSRFPLIDCRYASGKNSTTIMCSPVHIKKCLMNLVNNGMEAISGKGTVWVSASEETVNESFVAAHNVQPGNYIVLSIRDSGPGISSHDIEHIFEPFYSKKIMGRSGTGLGLAIVWNTVQDHGGTVRVESSEHGSCFKLYFPLGKEVSNQVADKSTTKSLHGNGEQILIVDDEATQREIAQQILSMHGYSVETVCSGEEAIGYVKQNSVDLVILDMLMEPGINGCTTYKEIRKIVPSQKALIASGFSESQDVKATLNMGAGGFIKKPYTVEQLCIAVRTELDR